MRRRERKQGEGAFGSSTPSAQIPLKPDSKPEAPSKKGGARAGHVGHGRQAISPEQADRVQDVPLEGNCPPCGEPLLHQGSRCRSGLDLAPAELKQIVYRLGRKLCPGCGARCQAKAPGLLARCGLGNQLPAELLDSHYLQGLPPGRFCANSQRRIGPVIDGLHRPAHLFEPAIAELIKEYRAAPARHADETSWRTDGRSGYGWLFCASEVSLHLSGRSRSGSAVREVPGVEPLSGYLVVDRYGGYSQAPCRLQYRYAHPMRDLEDLAKEFAPEAEVQLFCATLIPLPAPAQHPRNRPISDQQYYEQARSLKAEIVKVNQASARHPGIRYTQDTFLTNEARLYHWVADRRVPAENNRAERELRPTVIGRKVSPGPPAEEGAKSRSILLSVLPSLRKRVSHPKRKIKEALDSLAREGTGNIYQMLLGVDSS